MNEKQLEAIKNEYKPHIDAFDAKKKVLTEAKESRLKAIAAESAESEEPAEEPTGLMISLPMDGFTDSAFDNLRNR